MDATLIFLIILSLLMILVFYLLNKKLVNLSQNQTSKEVMQIIKMLQHSSQEDRKILLSSLQKNTASLNQRLDSAAKVIADVKKNVGEMSEIGRSMHQLQEFLQSPKIRGNIGEQVLKELLSQMLPKESFYLQHSFKSGVKVDAAIKTSAGIVPIDSKFPMENFRKYLNAEDAKEKKKALRLFEKDVRKHIRSISQKYILTAEGTIDYALMYIPSEAVYYEIVNNPKLFDYASKKRVLPVSPTTFYAYIKAILMSFEGQKIEKRAKEIIYAIKSIQKDYEKVDENLSTLQRHLTNANNMMGNVLSEFSLMGQKLSSTRKLEKNMEKLSS